MGDYIVLKQVVLQPRHQSTGKTVHKVGTEKLPHAHALKIVRFKDDDGYYLIYFDKTGAELADTYHDTVESAEGQAEWEYQVKTEDWEIIRGLN